MTDDLPLWRRVLSWRMLLCVLLGFSSGMPLWVTLQLIPAWLRDQGVNLETIGLFAIAGVPYTWKFAWSPLLDRFVLPGTSRRRGWAIVTQIVLAFAMAAYGLLDPVGDTWDVAALTLAVSFFSASQDIVLDAWRRELLPDRELGLGTSLFVNGYRLAGLVPGSLALILADHMPWSQVHAVVGAFMLVGVVTSLLTPDPPATAAIPRSLREAVLEPFREFFGRSDLRGAALLLAFMLLYKIGDSMATSMITTFYLDIGFTKTQIGAIAKVAGLWAGVTGATVGGVAIAAMGIYRSLWVFGVAQAVAVLSFAALSVIGPDPVALGVCVSADYLCTGLGTAAFLAFLAKTTHRSFSATQYALFSSLIALPRTVVNASTGYIITAIGWTWFFLFCAAAALPGMLLLVWVAPWGPDPGEEAS
ncbi:MAG TPA: AmpG family muropeptide MFS transporter [Myxococcota bacterium]|nr:AmpG family muropeptide MFS transporter [Myxococcota bacterium]